MAEEKTLEQQVAELRDQIVKIGENITANFESVPATVKEALDKATKKLDKEIKDKLKQAADEFEAAKTKTAADIQAALDKVPEQVKNISEKLPAGTTSITALAGAWTQGCEVTPTPELIAYFKEEGQSFVPRRETTTQQIKSQIPKAYIPTITSDGRLVDYVRIQDANGKWFLAPLELCG